MPVPLGGRAFEIIEILVQSAGELVIKDDMMGRVWPGTIVEENTLQVHISAIRKALGPDRDMLRTVPGHGYRLLGDWSARRESASAEPVAPAPARAPARPFLTNLPVAGSGLIGRTVAMPHLRDLLSAYRVVTLTGPGGIGKTTLALEIARSLFPTFQGDGWLVELAPLSDPGLVPSAVAGVLGLKMRGAEISPEFVARAIGERKLLLVLDNCEHVVDAAATLAETLARMCPHTSILATSRETLRIDGEYVYLVPSLDVPPPHQEAPGDVLEHSAVQLFIARTSGLHSGFLRDGKNLSAVADICRRLDGIPLAIEFAAAHAAAIGVRQVASRLDDRFGFLVGGRRTALPRHQTLRATLDWSYELLPEPERRLLRRLAVFPAGFTLEAATAVTSDAGADASAAVEDIGNLVTKSLVTLDGSASARRWRLLETIRAYALNKLTEAGELQSLSRRHAEYHRDLIETARAEWETRLTAEWLATYAPYIDDVRAALDWANSPAGDDAIGIALTVAALPLWFEMSLLEECRVRTERALSTFEEAADKDDRQRMQLYAAIALSQLDAYSAHDPFAAWKTALEIAEALDDTDYRLRALWGLWGSCVNRAEFREGLTYARRYSDLAASKAEANDQLVGDRLLGATLHFLGDQTGARTHIERMLGAYVAPMRRSHTVRFQSDQLVLARMYHARILWLQGFADQALRITEANMDEALQINHPLSLCNALAGAACPIAFLVGDLAAAERYTAMLLNQTARDVLDNWHAHGMCFEGELLARRGDPAAGLLRLRAGVGQLLKSGFGQFLVAAQCALAEALAAAGEFAQGLAVIGAAIERSERDQGHWCTAELLRIRGQILLQSGAEGAAATAEADFVNALELARRQHAPAWELRAATSLARLRRGQRRFGEARDLLRGVHGGFVEGHGTLDLNTAKELLAQFSPE